MPDLWPLVASGRSMRTRPARSRSRVLAFVVAAAVAFTGIGFGLAVLHGVRHPSPVRGLPRPSVTRIAMPGGARQIAFGFGRAWVLTRGGVARVNPQTNRAE